MHRNYSIRAVQYSEETPTADNLPNICLLCRGPTSTCSNLGSKNCLLSNSPPSTSKSIGVNINLLENGHIGWLLYYNMTIWCYNMTAHITVNVMWF